MVEMKTTGHKLEVLDELVGKPKASSVSVGMFPARLQDKAFISIFQSLLQRF